MGQNASRRSTFKYIKAELPNDLFAILRMEWRDEYNHVQVVDEYPLLRSTLDKIEDFYLLIKRAMKDGADIAMISPYDPQNFGMDWNE